MDKEKINEILKRIRKIELEQGHWLDVVGIDWFGKYLIEKEELKKKTKTLLNGWTCKDCSCLKNSRETYYKDICYQNGNLRNPKDSFCDYKFFKKRLQNK